MFPDRKTRPGHFEFADHGHAQSTAVAAGKIEAPLVGLRIVETQREKFEMAGGAVGDDLGEICAPSQTLRTTTMPSNSVHLVEPVNGCWRRCM